MIRCGVDRTKLSTSSGMDDLVVVIMKPDTKPDRIGDQLSSHLIC